MSPILGSADCTEVGAAGAKAVRLARLRSAGFDVPDFFVIPAAACDPHADDLPEALRDALREALRVLCPDGGRVAVRSSAVDEDGSHGSFAGQFDSHLDVVPNAVSAAVVRVWRSAGSERVLAYRRSLNLPPRSGVTAVIVQRQLEPEAAGVVFGADPASGRRAVAAIEAVSGLGSALMSGACEGDTFHVHRDGRIVSRNALGERAVLGDAQILAVADLAWKAGRLFGRPQDVEWAIENGRVYALQSRPLTTLHLVADPDATPALWDNSNVAESYPGITLPLTFSFARHAYEAVYREFCRLVGVPKATLAEHDDTFARMIGCIEGRVYYNLFSWYRLLATLPGFTLNRRFMEQMMGVSEGVPDTIAARGDASAARRMRDAVRLTRTLAGLAANYWQLRTRIGRFHARVDQALAEGPNPDEAPAETLIADYRRLERTLLKKWDAPLVNDFFAMIFYGVLRRLTQKWWGDAGGTAQNGLLTRQGRMISAEPARLIEQMAGAARGVPGLADALCERPVRELLVRLEEVPPLLALYRHYLEQFGDRSFEELKLESVPLSADPEPLLRSIGRTARLPSAPSRPVMEETAPLGLDGSPVRRAVFRWVLRHASDRIRDRENLRYQRTRVFARVRRIFRGVGREFETLGVLAAADDVFYLHIDEVLGFVEGTAVSTDLRGLVNVRRTEYDRYRASPVPDGRIETHGIPYVGQTYRQQHHTGIEGDDRTGTGSCPGEVEGVVSVVLDPRTARPPAGAILVAERTDPAWVLLFQSAAGLIVERGSLLSHSAVVARELGLPAIVGVGGATRWLNDGDRVRMNGHTGRVQKIGQPAREARHAR